MGKVVVLAACIIFLFMAAIHALTQLGELISACIEGAGRLISYGWARLTGKAKEDGSKSKKIPYSENEKFWSSISGPRDDFKTGKCEICQREFLRETSRPDHCLKEYSYNFYGRKRKRLLCDKCAEALDAR